MSNEGGHNTFKRKLRILDLLPDRAYGYTTARDLHERLGDAGFVIDRRGVERDLNELRGSFPLARDSGKPAGWAWLPHTKPPALLGMDDETALMYVMLERFLTPLLPKALYGRLIPMFHEAHRKLSAQHGGKLGMWNRRIVVDTAGQPLLSPDVDPRVQQVVSEALLRGRQCEFEYRPVERNDRDPPKPVRIAPVGLALRGGVQYLMGCFDGGAKVYTYALHRMSAPKLLDAPGHVPVNFDLEAHVVRQRAIDITHGETIRLDLRVNDWWAKFLAERRLSQDQTIHAIRGSDGRRVTATVADTEQLRWWLLSLGSGVEVLKPARLRKAMTKETAAMAARYRMKQTHRAASHAACRQPATRLSQPSA